MKHLLLWLRRRRGRSFEPIRVPFVDPDPLGGELTRHLFAALAAAPPNERRGSMWVMNGEWLVEIRKVAADAAGRSPFASPPGFAVVEHLLGLPIEVRDDGGVPHLEPR